MFRLQTLGLATLGLAAVALVFLAASLTGCGDKTTEEAAPSKGGDSEIEKALAELPAADRAAAEKQQVCPVSDEALGSMGKPVKVTVEGQDVFLCCAGCEDALREDPEKYFAKLKGE